MFDLKNYKNIYMIGIGGVSMSGLAFILKSWGYTVSGSNNVSSNMTDNLISNGINVFIPHDYNNINENIDLVVYTAAVKEDNPEMIHAKELNIPILERGEFLGEITKLYKDTIGISGTHGKTTTTSMVSLCFLEANLDPSIQVGSVLNSINGNYRVGKSDYFIIESCEYSDSFLNFHENSSIVLNIDNDHLDYFKTFDNIKKSFKKYVSHIKNVLVLNGDDKNCLELALDTEAKVLTFGLNETNNYYAKNITYNEQGYPSYDLYKYNEFIDRINLSIVGKHNVLNSLSCIALCDYYGININDIKNGLLKYTGAARRFEYKGEFKGAKVYDYNDILNDMKNTFSGNIQVAKENLYWNQYRYVFVEEQNVFVRLETVWGDGGHQVIADVASASKIKDKVNIDILIADVEYIDENHYLYFSSDGDEIKLNNEDIKNYSETLKKYENKVKKYTLTFVENNDKYLFESIK